jgi:phosphatidylserine decarboxylase
MVAAMVVGRITVTGVDARDVPFGTHAPNLDIERGAEIGQFHLGSTAVVLLEPRALDRWLAAEGPVRYGQAVAESELPKPSKRKSNGG